MRLTNVRGERGEKRRQGQANASSNTSTRSVLELTGAWTAQERKGKERGKGRGEDSATADRLVETVVLASDPIASARRRGKKKRGKGSGSEAIRGHCSSPERSFRPMVAACWQTVEGRRKRREKEEREEERGEGEGGKPVACVQT